MNLRSAFTELKRRRVYSVAAAYVVTGWLIIQVATQVFPFFSIPQWIVRLIILLLIVGFPVAVACAWAFEITPEGIKREGEPSRRAVVRKTGPKLTAVVVMLAAVAVGLTTLRNVHSRQRLEENKAANPEIPAKSIAVLPFGNLSDDEANAYFVSGIRDEVVTSLARLRDLNVRSRTSADKYKTYSRDVAVLGRELGIAYFIEGSVQKANDDVLINVQLIETQSGKHLWAQSYRGNLQNIFDVQGEVAQNVASALSLKLAPQEKRLLVPPTTNARAHELFLRAHALGAHADEKSLEGKIALVQQAVAEDPHYAMAWGLISPLRMLIARRGRFSPRSAGGPDGCAR